jgi:hypothetical protein
MASIKISIPPFDVMIGFVVKDAYVITPLGCHSGIIGNVFSTVLHKANKFGTHNIEEYLNRPEHDLYRKIMDELVSQAAKGFGEIKQYGNKAHWTISSPWGFTPEKKIKGTWEFGTPELMDLIVQFCQHEPEKYGHATITPPSECAVHGDNAGFPATRTLVWIPAYAKLSPYETITKVKGVYAPAFVGPPRKNIEPSVVSVVQESPIVTSIGDTSKSLVTEVQDVRKEQDDFVYYGERLIMEEQPQDILKRLEKYQPVFEFKAPEPPVPKARKANPKYYAQYNTKGIYYRG